MLKKKKKGGHQCAYLSSFRDRPAWEGRVWRGVLPEQSSPGDTGDVWGHLRLSRLGAPGIEGVGAKEAAPHPTVARTAPHRERSGDVSSARVGRPLPDWPGSVPATFLENVHSFGLVGFK